MISGLFDQSAYIQAITLTRETIGIELPILLSIFILIEWIGRSHEHALAHLGVNWNRYLRHALYYSLLFAIFWFGDKDQEFIYFQF